MTEIKVDITAGNEKEVKVISLEGKAPDPINLSPVSIAGNIYAVEDWLKTRVIDKTKSYILINPDGKKIELIINEGHPHKTTVTATLVENPALVKFGINTTSRYSPDQLLSLIRLNRVFFKSNEDHFSIMKNLKSINAQISAQIKDKDDERGNTENSVITQLTSNIDEKFTLSMPIYKGGPVKTFEVNILLEVRDKGISIWLESVELKELLDADCIAVFEEKKKAFEAQEYTVVTQ